MYTLLWSFLEQDAVKANPIIRDALDTIEEMSKLIKKSPRRQVI